MTTYRGFRKAALTKYGPVPDDLEGKEALKEKVWVEIKDLQWDQADAAARNDNAAVKGIQSELYLRYAMSSILSRAIRKEKRDANG